MLLPHSTLYFLHLHFTPTKHTIVLSFERSRTCPLMYILRAGEELYLTCSILELVYAVPLMNCWLRFLTPIFWSPLHKSRQFFNDLDPLLWDHLTP